MAIPDLTLETDKRVSNIDNDRIIIRQSERGLVLNATILKPDGTAYDLSGMKVQFADMKAGDKLVIDENVQIDSSQKGKVHYTLQKHVYDASGEGWFEIVSSGGNVVDTTQNFSIEVIPEAVINPSNDNYISSLEGFTSHMQVATEKAQEKVDAAIKAFQDKQTTAESNLQSLQNKISKGQSDADASLKELQNEVAKKKQEADNVSATLTSEFDAKVKSLNNELNAYSQKYKDLESKFTSEMQNATADQKKQATSDFQKKLSDLQADYNSWKAKTVNDFNATVKPIKDSISKNSQDLSAVSQQVNSTISSMQNLKKQFDAVDFSKFVKPSDLANYYTKAEVDKRLSTAGAVKTVDGISPDAKGNVATDHYTKKDTDTKLGTKVTFKKCDSPQAAYDISSKPAPDGSLVIGVYDPDDGPTEAVIGDKKITVSSLYDSLTALQTQVSGLSSLQSVVDGKADTADVVLKTDFDNTVNQLKASIATAGQVKTVNGAKPDNNGNVAISIPQPDLSSYAKKTDLNGLAKSSDLNGLAKSSDLNGLAKKTDLSNLATKDDVKNVVKSQVISKSDYDKLQNKGNMLYYVTE